MKRIVRGDPPDDHQQGTIPVVAIGGNYSANAGGDSVDVRADALASHAAQLLALVADTALRPSFPASEVALAEANALQSLKVQEADPDWQAQRAFGHAAYGDHPYARDSLSEASVRRRCRGPRWPADRRCRGKF